MEDAYLPLRRSKGNAGLARPAAKAPAIGILVGNDGIGARGERRTGKDAIGLARTDGALGDVPGGNLAEHAQRDRPVQRGSGNVGRAHGIAIHRAVVERRNVHIGRHILHENAAEGIEERHALVLLERREGCLHAGDRLIDAEQIR